MKNIILIITFFLLQSPCNNLKGQKEPIEAAADQFMKLFPAGDFVGAERSLMLIIDSGYEVPTEYRIFFYNGLGATNTIFSRYDEALYYYSMAEKYVVTDSDTLLYLSTIYINKAKVYGYQKSYDVAEDYFARAIRIALKNKTRDKDFYINLSTVYLDLGLFLFETHEYQRALDYLKRSEDIKKRFNIPELAFVYLNMAKVYQKIGWFYDAKYYFMQAQDKMTSESGHNYYGLSGLYFGYSQLLTTLGNYKEALTLLQEALSICKENYGEKHSLTSRAYQLIGDVYFSEKDYQRALEYYQNSLISVTEGFDNHDIFSNPSVDSSIFDLRLLDNLKRKSEALEMTALLRDDHREKLRYLNASLATIELAVTLTGRIRSKFLTRESRLWLSGNEKNTYLSGVRIAHRIYSITGDMGMMDKMYMFAGNAKARLLRDEISRNDLFHSSALPDSLWQKQRELESQISANNKQVMDESISEKPDTVKISRLKDAIFAMNRESERIEGEIKTICPEYRNLIEKTQPLSPGQIQRKLHSDQTVVDYYITAPDTSGSGSLYIFTITKDKITFYEERPDTLFFSNAALINEMNADPRSQSDNFSRYTGALSYMYRKLLEPVRENFSGRELIIIPDEEIAWLPFDALLATPPAEGQRDFESLDYLINTYIISTAYSSSLVFNDNRKRSGKVVSFLPDYRYNTSGDFRELEGAGEETEAIYRWFGGKRFEGERATKAVFMKMLEGGNILHLAMHSVSDTLNPGYSFLMFSDSDTLQEERVFNYEISLSTTLSPMVVISSCNSGSGRIFHGEGLMSIARSFMLAGAASVVKTSWKINDETSSQIMAGFYKHLSKGKPKNEAMRLARLDYLGKSLPAYTAPYYWAAYEVTGDTSPVIYNKKMVILVLIVILLAGAGFAVIYSRLRSKAAARSL